MSTEETFNFWMPLQAIKKSSSSKQEPSDKRWVQGIASTEAKDLQGEIVKQDGIDTSYLLTSGYFNFDHRPGAEFKIGEPTECKITDRGLWVKGFLYTGKKVADDVWEHITSLTKSGASRKMGFSIEGKVTKRSGSVIEKCWLQDIAITPAPVNTTTWAEVAKSLSKQKWSQGMSFDETVDFIQKVENLEKEDAATIAHLIFESL